MNYTLITGATGGLGGAFARLCAKRGDNLILTGTNLAKLEKITNEIKEHFSSINVIGKACDLSSADERKSFVDFLKENSLNVNYLINNAGYIAEGAFLNHTDDEIIKIIRVNCEGTIDITQKIIKMRDATTNLQIITVSSLAGDYPMPYMAIYAATKAMLKNFMVALNYELKGQGVYITTVCPSGIPTTDAMKDAIKSQGVGGKITACSPEKVAEAALKGAKKHKVIVVPKAINRFVKAISKPLSEKSLARIVGKRWKKSQAKRNMI